MQISEAYRTLISHEQNKSTPRNMIVKILEIQYKSSILKATLVMKQFTYKGSLSELQQTSLHKRLSQGELGINYVTYKTI